jgi:hypothetical protein
MKTKICTKCNTEKDLIDFNKQSTGKYGVFSICKVCKYKLNKQWRKNNKDKLILYRLKNKDKRREYERTYKKTYYQKNIEKERERCRKYYHKNKEKILKRNLERKMVRYYLDDVFRCTCAIRSLIRKSIIKKNYNKTSKTSEILGCNYNEFKLYIENKFIDGMTWNNYGKWHIDHIIPISSANNKEEVIKLNHYTNLQPLWAKDNIKKGNKIL